VLAEAAEDVAAAGSLSGGSKPRHYRHRVEFFTAKVEKSDLTECTHAPQESIRKTLFALHIRPSSVTMVLATAGCSLRQVPSSCRQARQVHGEKLHIPRLPCPGTSSYSCKFEESGKNAQMSVERTGTVAVAPA
jgi:hypothetical protein